jgi:pimeloyl-ACP methyl ester carboxylesterase
MYESREEDGVYLAASQPPPVGSRFVQTRHRRLHYREAGRGGTIVLLHINRQSSALYLELIEALSADFHVLAPDYPGYGLSEPIGAAPSIADYAGCVRALLDAKGIGRATMLGEVVGAAVATEFAVRYPAATAGVVLINCPFMADARAAATVVGSARSRAAQANDDQNDEAFISRHGQHAPLLPSPSWVARVREAHRQCGNRCWQAADALLAYDLRAALRRMRAPALLVTGEFSPFAGFMPELNHILPGARSHVLAQSRFGIGWERAADVARLVGEFVVEEVKSPEQT